MSRQPAKVRGSLASKLVLDRLAHWISRNSFFLLLMFFIVLVALPWFAPLFMKWGWDAAGHAIYRIYSLLCHQLPQRSFFLFGPQVSYSLEQLKEVGVNTFDMLELRSFIGTPAMGYKVAWSDRMVSLYSSLPLAGLMFKALRKRTPRLPFWGLILLTLPMVIDGASHFVSDIAGIGQGFRAANSWLVSLTGGIFSDSFYAGAAMGSFNSWMRFLHWTSDSPIRR
jgi:uncharacterized membrane protein